jgi:alkyl sulfatase BDS1-like metallo-beta-lactamase superfamily hydrolase
LENNAKADPSVTQRVNGSYKFAISGGAGGDQTWLVSLKNGQAPSVKKGDGEADCTINMKEEDFMALMQGKLDGQSAFMQGKLKIKGSIHLHLSYCYSLHQLHSFTFTPTAFTCSVQTWGLP